MAGAYLAKLEAAGAAKLTIKQCLAVPNKLFEAKTGIMLSVGALSRDRMLGLFSFAIGHIAEAIYSIKNALDFCRKAEYRPELAWTYCVMPTSCSNAMALATLRRLPYYYGKGWPSPRSLVCVP